MAKRYFAQIGLNTKIDDVTTIDSSLMTDINGVEHEQMGINFLKKVSNWDLLKQYWPDGSQRKNPAAKGHTYDETRDAFISPKPYPSFILNESSCRWEAPAGDPPDDDNRYVWNEDTKAWDQAEA